MKLIIAEKPSVAAAIAKALGVRGRNEGYIEGNGYIVSWCFGHLIELADAKEYNPRYERWAVDDLPIVPDKWKYHVLPDKKEQFRLLKTLMNDDRVSGLVCATDAGREGELIFRLVYEYARCRKPFQRLWISSMEDSAIRTGFEQLKDGSEYDRLYASANCRSQADWLVGINATRLFTCLYHNPLPVGRVQTPTLAMLVERERRIAGFRPEKTYSVKLDFGSFTADSDKMPLQEAERLQVACNGQKAQVISLEQKDNTVNSPRLYDLTTLQRDANRLHGMTAQQTLDSAQSLYEKKLITYPRTDSKYIPSDMEQEACALVGVVCSIMPWAKGLALQPDMSRHANDAKVGDHHALLPTRQLQRINLATLNEQDLAILNLVCQRLVLSASPAHLYRSVEACLECASAAFKARGKTTTQEGWKAVQKQINAGDTDEDSETQEADKALPPLEVGQSLPVNDATLNEHTTTAPRHYTEDTLLSAMETAGNDELDKTLDTEKKGLGTPATRAGIIEKLIKSGLAERNKKQILPTEKGCKLVDIVPDIMKSPKLTAQWENQLTEIAGGQREAGAFMGGIMQLVEGVMQEKGKRHDRSLFAGERGTQARKDEREVIGKCPRCGENVYETKVNFRCSGAECGFALWKDARFFTSKQKTLKKTAAKSLLKTGRAKMRGFVSENTGNKFDATVVMEDTGGKYVRYRLEYEPRK